MAKLNFEKDRRNRLPKDICTDAPWRSNFVPASGGSYHGNNPTRGRSVARTTPEPSGGAERLRGISAELAGPDFANLPSWKKLRLRDHWLRCADLGGYEALPADSIPVVLPHRALARRVGALLLSRCVRQVAYGGCR